MNKRGLLLIMLMVAVSVSVYAQEVVIKDVSGAVHVLVDEAWDSVSPGKILKGQERLRTGKKSSCLLIFMQGHELRISAETELELAQLTNSETNIKLNSGKGRAKVRKLSKNEKFGIETETSLCSVRGTDFSVEVLNDVTRVEVYEGVVAAQEETTGSEVLVHQGEFSVIEYNQAPSDPEPLPEADNNLDDSGAADQLKFEARLEMFNEISRDQVMARAADEIKLAEFQNGKVLTDASGLRVRLEEYIVRPQDDQFKYVVLNTRENRFDFAKILYTFTHANNTPLPADLSIVTKDMFVKEGNTAPEWSLDAMDSIISNTYDKILEEADGGKYTAVNDYMVHSFTNYRFYVGNADSTENDRKGKLRWEIANNIPKYYYFPPDGNGSQTEQVSDPSTTGNVPITVAGELHEKYVDEYDDGFKLQFDAYLIDDDGNYDVPSLGQSAFTDLNYEFVYTSDSFSDEFDNKIDIAGSLKLLQQANIIQ